MQGWVCGQAACAFKFFIFLHNLTCPPARGVEPARLFLGPELWRLGYRDTEKEFYCVVSAGQTFNPSILLSQHNQEAKKEIHSLQARPRHKTTTHVWYCATWLFINADNKRTVHAFVFIPYCFSVITKLWLIISIQYFHLCNSWRMIFTKIAIEHCGKSIKTWLFQSSLSDTL